MLLADLGATVLRLERHDYVQLGTDKPGRAFSSVGHGRSAVEQVDRHEQEEQRFLTKVAAHLDQAVLAGDTPSLIVVAPPRAIGILRRAFTSHVRQAIRAEVEKDFVKLPVKEIAAVLGMTVGAVRTRQARALVRLRSFLE